MSEQHPERGVHPYLFPGLTSPINTLPQKVAQFPYGVQNNVREIVWVGLIKLLSFSDPEYYVFSNILIYSGHPYILVRIWVRPVGKKVRYTFL